MFDTRLTDWLLKKIQDTKAGESLRRKSISRELATRESLNKLFVLFDLISCYFLIFLHFGNEMPRNIFRGNLSQISPFFSHSDSFPTDRIIVYIYNLFICTTILFYLLSKLNKQQSSLIDSSSTRAFANLLTCFLAFFGFLFSLLDPRCICLYVLLCVSRKWQSGTKTSKSSREENVKI